MNLLQLYLLAIIFLIFGASTVCQENLDFDKYQLLDEISENVKLNFYETTFDSIAWNQEVDKYRLRLSNVKTLDSFDFLINELLSSLKTSHTSYYSRNNPKRYQLLGIFDAFFGSSDTTFYHYEGIGIDTKIIDGKVFILSVYDGLPADQSGLKYGDQIVSVDGKKFNPIKSFEDKTNLKVEIKIIRQGQELNISVPVKVLDGRSMFVDAFKSSIKIVKRKNKEIGYVHMWSYAGSKYQEELQAALLWGELSKCDALVVDLRDGWGGADFNYLNLFRKPIAIMKNTTKDGVIIPYSGVWEKPVVLLINNRTTSGKEIFTYGFKKLKLGTVLGEQTAGSVVAGSPYLLSNGDLLYLAVRNVYIDDKRLEGIGVQPDVVVDRPLEFETIDPQIERAFEELSTKIEDK